VAPEDPENPGVGVGVATIESVSVVELDHHLEGLSRFGSPLEDLLSPQHPQIVVDGALAQELCLGSIPQRVVGRRAGKLFERVDVLAPIAGVFRKCFDGPIGQRLPTAVVRAFVADVEAELAPGNELVEKRLGIIARAPPSRAPAVCRRYDILGRPALATHDLEKNFVRRDMAEMKVGGKATRDLGLGPVPLVAVEAETTVEEAAQGGFGGQRSSTNRSDSDGVIDRQRRQRVTFSSQHGLGCGWPPPSRGSRKGGRRRQILGERVLERNRRKVVEEVLLEKPPKRVRSRELAVGGRHRQHAIAVDGLEENRDFRGGGGHHRGEEERRIVVGDDNCRIGSKGLQEPVSGTVIRLYVWYVGDVAPFKRGRRIGHAVDDEPVEPVARPRIVATEGLENHQRETEIT
jgi:hypothetical protein